MSDIVEIIESCDGSYEVARLCAILEIKDNEKEIDATDPLIKNLNIFFDNITYNAPKHSIELMQTMSYSKYMGCSNEQLVRHYINELKKYLSIADITIIEQRLPLEQVSYKLTEES